MEDYFGKHHPAVCFAFFIGAVAFGMFFVHPAFLVSSVITSAIYYFQLKKSGGIKFFAVMLCFTTAVALINPLINSNGKTALFYWLNGRAFTLEALLYGISTAGMFFSMLLWFSCYNEIMTSDKFTYLFGGFIPSISLVLCMILRLVPNLRLKIAAIANARKSIGKSAESGKKTQKLNEGMTIISTLTSWSLESAIVTADSMKSRGYGSAPRTNYSMYRFSARDIAVMGTMAIAVVAAAAGSAFGGTAAEYMPKIDISSGSPAFFTAITGYILFLITPSAINFWEDAKWRILKSRI